MAARPFLSTGTRIAAHGFQLVDEHYNCSFASVNKHRKFDKTTQFTGKSG
jgi:hypothetical protein